MHEILSTGPTKLALGLTAAMCCTGAFAHHSARITYDMDQVIEVEGEITRVMWRNPHLRQRHHQHDGRR